MVARLDVRHPGPQCIKSTLLSSDVPPVPFPVFRPTPVRRPVTAGHQHHDTIPPSTIPFCLGTPESKPCLPSVLGMINSYPVECSFPFPTDTYSLVEASFPFLFIPRRCRRPVFFGSCARRQFFALLSWQVEMRLATGLVFPRSSQTGGDTMPLFVRLPMSSTCRYPPALFS